MIRTVLKIIVGFLFKLLSHVHVTGLENVPQNGGVILAVNHLSYLDAPLIFVVSTRDDVTALVTSKYQKHWLFRRLINGVRGIWINREEADVHALKAALAYLQQGGALGIAPEGTRSTTGSLIPAKTGAAYLATKAGVPIVPVAVTGTETAVRKLLSFRRPHIILRFGKPFHLPPLDRKDRAGSLQRNTDAIMCRIAALLPPEYRGVYADHPCLRELLHEESLEAEHV